MTGYNPGSIVRISQAKVEFMDTDDLDQLERHLHELILICADLREENDALRKQLKQKTEQINDLEQQKTQIEGKVGRLLSSLGPVEPDHE